MLVSVISLCLPVLPLNKQQHVLGYNGLMGYYIDVIKKLMMDVDKGR